MFEVYIPGGGPSVRCRELGAGAARKLARLAGKMVKGSKWWFNGGERVGTGPGGSRLFRGELVRSDEYGNHVEAVVIWDIPAPGKQNQ